MNKGFITSGPGCLHDRSQEIINPTTIIADIFTFFSLFDLKN